MAPTLAPCELHLDSKSPIRRSHPSGRRRRHRHRQIPRSFSNLPSSSLRCELLAPNPNCTNRQTERATRDRDTERQSATQSAWETEGSGNWRVLTDLRWAKWRGRRLGEPRHYRLLGFRALPASRQHLCPASSALATGGLPSKGRTGS